MGCSEDRPPFLAEYPQIDRLIEGGQVLDGLGYKVKAADVVVVGDRIVYVGETHVSAADELTRISHRINAAGRIVSPGFIDLHSHGDPMETPTFENFLAMGVTTLSLGQDGDSPETENMAHWLGRVAAQGIGTNLAMFVGHGTFAKIPEEYVIKRQWFSLAAAVRKMTSQPAGILGLTDPGVVAVDHKTALLIFDPDRIKATATYPQPLQLAEGFAVVIVNGQIARQDDRLAAFRAGLMV